MTNEEVESKAYRLIRIAARNAIDPMNDEQLANYVKGIVDLQSELYSVFIKKEEEKWDTV